MFDAMFTLIGHSGAYVNQRGLHPPRGIHGRGAGAFQCKDGKYVQFDTSSARHLVWFAREAGITDWGPELLDVVRLRDEAVNQQLHARLARAVPDPNGGRMGGGRQACRRRDRLGANTGRVDRHRPRAADRRGGRSSTTPNSVQTWMAGLPVHLTATPGSPRGPRHVPNADRQSVDGRARRTGCRTAI